MTVATKIFKKTLRDLDVMESVEDFHKRYIYFYKEAIDKDVYYKLIKVLPTVLGILGFIFMAFTIFANGWKVFLYLILMNIFFISGYISFKTTEKLKKEIESFFNEPQHIILALLYANYYGLYKKLEEDYSLETLKEIRECLEEKNSQ